MNALYVIAGVGVLSLVAEIINLKRFLTWFAAIGLACAIASVYVLPSENGLNVFNRMLFFDTTAMAFTWLIIIVAIFWLWMSNSYLADGVHQTDKTSLVVFVVLGAVIMASFNNMAMLFLGLEILSLSLYALAGSRKDSLSSIEASFKYFLMGSFATGFLLFGIALVYGATRSFDIGVIYQHISNNTESIPAFFYAGVLLMLVGLAFKISAVPFHFWAPDVYEGSPTAVTSLMATVVKIAAFAAFWRIFGLCFSTLSATWDIALKALVVLTLVIPNITAIYQSSPKRMLAYSSVAHVGYILLGFMAAVQSGFTSPLFLTFYLAAYSVSSLAAFSVLMRVEANGGSFDGLYYRNKMMAVTMIIALMSMAGIPPLAGFAAKYYVFVISMAAKNTGFVLLAVTMSLVSVYYYFRIIVSMFRKEQEVTPLRISWSLAIFHFLMILLMIAGGLFPSIRSIAQLLGQ